MAHHFLPLATTILLIFCLPITLATSRIRVRDIFRRPLQVGTPYYIRTAVSQVGIGGGVVVASKPGQPQCPQYAGHLSVGFLNETPVMFYPSDPSQNSIYLSSDINIVFNATSNACSQGTWKLTPEANSDKVFISTGGVLGNPTAETLFKIERDDGSPLFYQFKYCPSGSTGNIMCGAINTIDFTDDDELGWLGLAPARDSYFAGLSFIRA